ncbi:hypothetical protein B0H16DRAFT_1722105 [Mycena metata]|uniref:Uncharacterized protein n=1 Tax=Mycena metata TaxID=1033252 RepID=A0AAD7ND89_9AGAR|nr:hypothetical protein B0H16DRAFT_1722105 [Mycena metata]
MRGPTLCFWRSPVIQPTDLFVHGRAPPLAQFQTRKACRAPNVLTATLFLRPEDKSSALSIKYPQLVFVTRSNPASATSPYGASEASRSFVGLGVDHATHNAFFTNLFSRIPRNLRLHPAAFLRRRCRAVPPFRPSNSASPTLRMHFPLSALSTGVLRSGLHAASNTSQSEEIGKRPWTSRSSQMTFKGSPPTSLRAREAHLPLVSTGIPVTATRVRAPPIVTIIRLEFGLVPG